MGITKGRPIERELKSGKAGGFGENWPGHISGAAQLLRGTRLMPYFGIVQLGLSGFPTQCGMRAHAFREATMERNDIIALAEVCDSEVMDDEAEEHLPWMHQNQRSEI